MVGNLRSHSGFTAAMKHVNVDDSSTAVKGLSPFVLYFNLCSWEKQLRGDFGRELILIRKANQGRDAPLAVKLVLIILKVRVGQSLNGTGAALKILAVSLNRVGRMFRSPHF